MADRYIWVNKWDAFQTFQKKRGKPWTPPWIKNHTHLLHDDEYRRLSGHRRAILHGLWLEFASTHGRLRLDTLSISRRLDLRVRTPDLVSLNHAGFILFCSGTVLEQKRNAFWNSSALEESRREENRTEPVAVDVGVEAAGAPEANGTATATIHQMRKDTIDESLAQATREEP